MINKNFPLQVLSKVNQLPIISSISPSAKFECSQEVKMQYLVAQNLAVEAIDHVAEHVVPGWSEVQAATLIETYLRDNGVSAFFHKPFVWFGENTRFNHVEKNKDYLPSERLLKEGEVFILDVAPIVDNFCVDVGIGYCSDFNPEFTKAQKFLYELKKEIPKIFLNELGCKEPDGKKIWQLIDKKITDAGYDNIHSLYPFSVLGHRLHKVPTGPKAPGLLNFGWQSYWSFISRGLFGQLLNHNFSGSLQGLWAVEPHIGTKKFGTKFEEILVVEENACYWLSDLSSTSN